MKFIYVDYESTYYKEAVVVRINAFFKGMDTASDLIEDAIEKQSLHLVCLQDTKVVGMGRLTINNDKAIISQMAVKDSFKRKGVGTKIIELFILKSLEIGVPFIELSARETAISFYEKQGFVSINKKYPSVKTGIMHQKMMKILK